MEVKKENIILGIDPGTKVLGYGLITIQKPKIIPLQYGILNLSNLDNQALKLKRIFEQISELVEEYNPDEMALESPFYGQNIQVALKLGRAQGVAMLAGLIREIPISEYAPRKIKQVVTGNGNASKEQVAKMLDTLLDFSTSTDIPLDATDALAVAVCHHYQGNLPQNQSKSWEAFLKENPDRVK